MGVSSILANITETEGKEFKEIEDNWFKNKILRVKNKPEENPNWRILDNQLYFYSPDPLTSSLNLDNNQWKPTIPKELRKQVLIENHGNKQAGHLGMEKTYAKISENYFWPGMYSETLKYVKKMKNFPENKTEGK